MNTQDFGNIFEKEWSLYRKMRESVRKGEPKAHLKSKVRFGTLFDGGVKKGEIRLLADSVPPRLALVKDESEVDSWEVVPLSDFTVPANEGEALVGNRVYQFWNVRSLPKSRVARSWIVDVVNKSELSEIGKFFNHVMHGRRLPKSLSCRVGRSSKGSEASRLEYECEFILSDDSFDYVIRDPVVVDGEVFRAIPYRYAADDHESPKQSCLICNEEYSTCTLERPFVSLRNDVDPGTLVFSLSKAIPRKWHVGKNARVTLHDRVTTRQIGEGRIDMRKREVIIDQFDGLEGLQRPVERASDAVILISTPRHRRK